MRVQRKFIIVVTMSVLLSIVNYRPLIANEKIDVSDEWTVLCYLAGNNFLDWSVKEIIKTGASDNVNVITFLDTTDDDTKIFEINQDGPLRIPTRIVNYSWSNSGLNTGDPNTLINFATWAVRNYPAKKYFLILGGYGEGWIGLMHDMNDGQKNIDIPVFKRTRVCLR